MCNPHQQIQRLSRDGVALAPDWKPFEEYIVNLGSGLTAVPADQTCDCDVALGTHRYEVVLDDMARRMSVDVVDGTDETASYDTEESTTDLERVMPWDIPEPQEVQGLDCIAVCEDSGGSGTVFPIIPIDCAVTAPGGAARHAWPALILFLGLPIWLVRKIGKRSH
jgi:hypothetical protein